MKARLMARAGIKVTLVALLVGGLLPVAPAAAQTGNSTFWSLMSAPVKVVRKGVTYKMTITAYDSGGQESSFNVTLEKTLDPSGVRKSTQSHTFHFPFNDSGEFVHNEPKTLATARVNTARDMAPYGAASLKFKKTSGVNNTCSNGGKDLVAKGVLSGDFKFKTDTARFGTITERPRRATLMNSTGFCQDGGGIDFCPPPATSVYGARTKDNWDVSAYREKGSRSVTVSSSYGKDIRGDASRWALISATLPARKVKVASNLASATINGAKKTYLSGTAKFVATAPLQRDTSNCTETKTFTQAYRSGIMKGDFKATYWLGGNKKLSSGRMKNASANRYS